MIAGPGIIVLDVRGVVEVEGRGGATSKPSSRRSRQDGRRSESMKHSSFRKLFYPGY